MSRSKRRMKKHESLFKDALRKNNGTYNSYYDRLLNIALTCFDYENLPETCDVRMLELTLLSNGSAVFFNDDVIGFLVLPVLLNGNFDVYGNPLNYQAYSNYNHYRKKLNADNSVLIYNNYLRQGDLAVLNEYAERLYNLDRIVDVNTNAQKTPILLKGTDKQQLSLKNIYMQYDGNYPVIYGDKSLDQGETLTTLNTGAPYVSDKIYQLKQEYWNEVLTYLGIANIQTTKKERLITDEVQRAQGGVFASRASRLKSREYAVEKINDLFNLDIKVRFNDNIDIDFKEGGAENGEVYNNDKNILREPE